VEPDPLRHLGIQRFRGGEIERSSEIRLGETTGEAALAASDAAKDEHDPRPLPPFLREERD
jgi:hypothetical protein